VQELNFLSTEGNGAKITLGQPDPKEWDLVEVFAKYTIAVAYAKKERECSPGIPLLIQPFRGGEAALFRKRV
jgi:hypothetical protein